jgi:fibro-slime domain-containing protein
MGQAAPRRDGVFAGINGHLVIDLGGVHTVQEDEVDLDAETRSVGITVGAEDTLHFFIAERHTELSNLRSDTSIVFEECGGGGEPR